MASIWQSCGKVVELEIHELRHSNCLLVVVSHRRQYECLNHSSSCIVEGSTSAQEYCWYWLLFLDCMHELCPDDTQLQQCPIWYSFSPPEIERATDFE